MVKYFLQLIVFFFLVSGSSMAQTDESIDFSADRPGAASPPDIATIKKIQLEDGFQYSRIVNGDIRFENFLFNNFLLRYGLFKCVELRLETNYAYNIITDSAGPSVVYGLTPFAVGTKIRILDQHKMIPNLSLLMNLIFPLTGKTEFSPRNLAPAFTLLMSNQLTEKLNLCYNYGIAWDGNTSVPLHFYAVCLGIGLTGKLSTFAEVYGYSAIHAEPLLYMDTGLAFMILGNLQADFSVAISLNDIRDYLQLNTGIAWKINGKKSMDKKIDDIKTDHAYNGRSR